MPYIDNAGAGSLVDSINGAGDRIRGSLKDMYGRTAQAEEQNRLLHPATNKWLQKVMSGEMGAAEAAVAAHAEIDANQNGIPDAQEGGLSGGKMGDPGGQGASGPAGGMTTSLSPSSMATLNSGMTGSPMDRPMTQRDLGDAQGIAKVATPYVKADAQKMAATTRAGGQLGVAEINNAGAGDRNDATIKYKEKADKQKQAQFDTMMTYRYEALKERMKSKGMELDSKERISMMEQGGKHSEAILKKDMDDIKNIRDEIVRLQDEKVRAGKLNLDPELAAQSDKMIQDLQAELGHLQRSVNVEIRMKGGRPGGSGKAPSDMGGNYTPGNTYPPANGGEGPNYTPAQEPVDRSGRLPPARGNTTGQAVQTSGDFNADASSAVPNPQGLTFKTVDRATGESTERDAGEVEAEIREIGLKAFKQKYSSWGWGKGPKGK